MSAVINVTDDASRGRSDQVPPSPPGNRQRVRKPYRQPRFIWGAALVVASVLLGVLVVGAADSRVTVWAASHDLAAGTVVTADDLIEVSVQLSSPDRYLDARNSDIVGKRLSRQIMQDELVPVGAVDVGLKEHRYVTVPVEPIHSPTDLAHGDRVDVYVSPRDSVSSGGASRLVVARALVASVATDVDSAAGELAVVLDVETSQAAALVSASRGGVLDLVHVPAGAI